MAQINIKKNDSTSISTPPSGIEAIFVANDGNLYTMNSYGTVSSIGGGGGSGTSGSSGSSGTSGINGTSGSSGSSGTSGINGNDGSSGTSGVSGTSGTSPAGGGAAGLISGVGLNSVQSNTTLTPGATAIGENSIAIGSTVSAYYQSIYVGTNITDIGTSSVYIGNNINQSYGVENNSNSVLIGSNLMNRTSSPDTDYIGSSIVIGNAAKIDTFAKGNENISIGARASSSAFNESSITMGSDASTGRFWSIAIGRQANASNAGCIAIGAAAGASGDTSVSIGRASNASSDLTIAIGYVAAATSLFTVAIGPQSAASAQRSVAIGWQTAASHANSVVLGVTMSSVVTDHTHVRSLFIDTCPVYADNTAALAGGLVAGQVYRTSTGVLMITY